VRRSFADQPEEATRIVVTHHPFEGASANDDDGIVGRARMAMGVFSQSRVDVILSGHLHLNRMGSSAVRYNIEGYSALLIQAGTAISSRRRLEANSFNLIRIEPSEIHLECRAWMPGETRFVGSTSKSFRRGRSGWGPTGGTTIPTLVQNADDGLVRADDRIDG
jgi:3',5'-cyclic AMP phosphodiesterase CpdA